MAVYPSVEYRLIQVPGGMAWLDARLRRGALTENDITTFRRLCRGLLNPDLPPPTGPDEPAWNYPEDCEWSSFDVSRALDAFGDPFLAASDALAHCLYGLLPGGRPETEELFLSAARLFLDEVLSLALDPPTTTGVLINNAFHAFATAKARFLPRVRGVVVDRDPRDQYVELRRAKPSEMNDVARFIDRFRGHRCDMPPAESRSVIKGVTVSRRGDRLLALIRFEDFVLNEDFRTSLADVLDLDLACLEPQRAQGRLDFARSAANVGKFKEFPEWKAEISRIEFELADHLHNA